jgi:hypothetical protein
MQSNNNSSGSPLKKGRAKKKLTTITVTNLTSITVIKLTDNKNNQIIILIYNINDTLFTTVP